MTSADILNIVLSALGVIITGLASWAVSAFTKWLNTKISDAKAANYISTVLELVVNCVNETYQTYVTALKKEGKFDEEAQKKALEACLAKIKSQLSDEIITYITDNFGDLTTYLTTLIESTIYTDKLNNTALTTTATTTVVETETEAE